MKNQQQITPRELYRYAKLHNLLDAPIRVCDAMAASFYPRSAELAHSDCDIVVDVSSCDIVEYDDLTFQAQNVHYKDI